MELDRPGLGSSRRPVDAGCGGRAYTRSPVQRSWLGIDGQEWSCCRCVTASPLVEHLALAATDVLLACCNLALLAHLRPPWYQEASDDVRSDDVDLPRPSMLYVTVLASVCGLGAIVSKTLVLLWCMSKAPMRASAHVTRLSAAACALVVPSEFPGSYYVCLRVVLTLFSLWILVTGSIFQLLGAPLEAFPSSLLLGVFFATVGFFRPYASAVAEACRSTRWNADDANKDFTKEAEKGTATQTPTLLPRSGGACLPFLRMTNKLVAGFLRTLDFLCFPIVYLCETLLTKTRGADSGAGNTLNPHKLANLLIYLSVLPLIVCCTMCLASSILLPMDWPTVYVVYPSPLIIFISLGFPLACIFCFIVLLLVPVYCSFPSRYARAMPILQEMMLKQHVSPSKLDLAQRQRKCADGVPPLTVVDAASSAPTATESN